MTELNRENLEQTKSNAPFFSKDFIEFNYGKSRLVQKHNTLNKKNLECINDIDELPDKEVIRLNNELIKSQKIIERQNNKLLEYEKLIEELAMRDCLTDAYNRRYFNLKIYEEIKKLKELNSNIVLTFIDLDDFKIVNDKLGHLEGDKLLKNFVSICKQFLRKDLDLVFRFGGDEFLIMSIQKSKEKAHEIIKNINKKFKNYTDISEISYGIVEILSDGIMDDACIEKYLNEADKRMYQFKNNKNSKGNCIR